MKEGGPLPERTISGRMGPLVVHDENPRYFADGQGAAVYLTGSHTWNNFKDCGHSDPPPAFDWDAYLDALVDFNHNFIRLWHWEATRSDFGKWVEGAMFWDPFPWVRSGPGDALDGKLRFDLETFNEAYFERLRSRVTSAGARGIYVSVMLFEGWEFQFAAEPWCWTAHPFHRDNNVNGLDGNPGGDARNLKTHTLELPEVTRVQEAYLRKVVDTVNDLDNVLYEVTNESVPASTQWQYHIIDFVKEYEAAKPKQHPVGMTFQFLDGGNDALFDSPADWISPNQEGGYRVAPPAADGSKVIFLDTDHLWGIGGDRRWVWKTFTRGMNPLFMDPWEKCREWKLDEAVALEVRRNLGYTRRFAERVDLAKTTPRQELASSGYCLANPGGQRAAYIVYLPDGDSVTVDLSDARGQLAVEWFDPATGQGRKAETVEGGSKTCFTCPYDADAVLFISKG